MPPEILSADLGKSAVAAFSVTPFRAKVLRYYCSALQRTGASRYEWAAEDAGHQWMLSTNMLGCRRVLLIGVRF